MGKKWKEVQCLAAEAVEASLSLPKGSVIIDLELEDPDLQNLIDDLKSKRAALREAQSEVEAALGEAARTLTKFATVRDVGAMLDCSYQYVSRLAPKSQP